MDLNDYPPGYLLNNIGGEVVVRLTVRSDGNVQDCTGLGRKVDRFFLQAVCDKLRKYAVFEPALDQQGRAIAAPYIIAASFGVES
jgi:TonB family protein